MKQSAAYAFDIGWSKEEILIFLQPLFTIDALVQILIFIVSGTVAYLVTRKKVSLRKWGFLLGVFAQPLWIYATFVKHQYGMMALEVWYFMLYIESTKEHFNE